MTGQLSSTVWTLRSEGYSTPEICQQLGLDSDTVIGILLQGQGAAILVPPPNFPTQRAERLPGGAGERLMGEIITLLTRETGRSGLPVWTFPALTDALKRSAAPSLSRDTLRRYLVKQGLTFTSHLKMVMGTTVLPNAVAEIATSSRALLYVVSHRVFQGGDDSRAATLITGITPFNRIALLARNQSRLSPGMLWEFLKGLLALHPERQVVVIAKSEGVYRSIWPELRTSQNQRLHYFLSKNG